MCEYCNEPYENMCVSEGYIKIRKSKYSPSGYLFYCAQIQAAENMEKRIVLYGIAACAVDNMTGI